VRSSHPRHAHIAGFDLHASVAHILLTLKSPWADGTRHLMFAPMELLEKLAALTRGST
jgi:hypothetical protein